jgi:hypothetical protein
MRQHKRNRRDQRFLRVLATRHRAIHHFAHVMAAIHIRMRRCLFFLVMMLRDGAAVTGAARHRVHRPRSARQWCVQSHSRQQAHPRG